MKVLTATTAHHGGIALVVIKRIVGGSLVVVTDPETGIDYSLYQSTATHAELMKFVDQHKYTEDAQLLGTELTPEPVQRTGPVHTYYWRAPSYHLREIPIC